MPSFSIPWNTFSTADGPHTIYAVVRDSSGNTVTTSTVTVTVSNPVPPGEDPPPEVEDPPTPPPPPTVPPTVVSNTTIPLGAVFYNTLGEFSTFVAEAVFPSAVDPAIDTIQNDEWINVRDEGAVGDGEVDDTAVIQATLDKGSLLGKKVLFPAGFTFKVGFPNMDSWWNGYWGAMANCFWLDDNAKIMLEGTIKPYYVPGGLLDFCTGGVVFANRKSFKFISGANASAGDYFPEDYTGERQGLDETGSATTGGVPSTTIQLSGDPDLSGFVAGPFRPIPDGILTSSDNPGSTRNLGLRVFNSPYQSEILSVDNTAKTLEVADPLTLSGDEYTIENNDYNENIYIFGNGTVDFSDLGELNGFAAYWLGRFYRVRNLVVEGITIKAANALGMQIGWGEHVRLSNLTFRDFYDNGASYDNAAALDVCKHVLIENCRIFDCPIGSGFFLWACRDVKCVNCSAVDMCHASSGVGGIIDHQGYGMEFVGTSFITNMVEGIGYYDVDPEEIWGMHDFGAVTLDNLGDAVDWNILVSGCTTHRCGYGLMFLSETYYGGFGRGLVAVNNHFTSNYVIGIGLGSTYGTILDGNVITNGGFGTDDTNPYTQENYTEGENKPVFD